MILNVEIAQIGKKTKSRKRSLRGHQKRHRRKPNAFIPVRSQSVATVLIEMKTNLRLKFHQERLSASTLERNRSVATAQTGKKISLSLKHHQSKQSASIPAKIQSVEIAQIEKKIRHP